MHPDKLKNIQNLSPQERYGYFIQKVADSEEVWVIQDNGSYVTIGQDAEKVSIPVWPEKDFAELLLTESWKDHSLTTMKLDHFIDWLDQLEAEGIEIAGFPMSDLSAVVVSAIEMKNHLLYELQQYE